MFSRLKHMTGVGSVNRPDGLVVRTVPYEISLYARWLLRHGRTTSVRLQIHRQEAMYWFLESGTGLRLTVEDGRRLNFALDGVPDHSGWIRVSAGGLARG
jgi:hypothetical protein